MKPRQQTANSRPEAFRRTLQFRESKKHWHCNDGNTPKPSKSQKPDKRAEDASQQAVEKKMTTLVSSHVQGSQKSTARVSMELKEDEK